MLFQTSRVCYYLFVPSRDVDMSSLVMALPIGMLKRLQIPLSQKIGLGAVFLLGAIDTIFDITRTLYTVHGGAVAEDTIWDILEPTIAVMVSSLPPYRSVLANMTAKSTEMCRRLLSTSRGRASGTSHGNGSHELNDLVNKTRTFGSQQDRSRSQFTRDGASSDALARSVEAAHTV